MNIFTAIALAVICIYVLYGAVKVLEKVARDIAREQGKRRALEHRALMMRLQKSGEWGANNEWC